MIVRFAQFVKDSKQIIQLSGEERLIFAKKKKMKRTVSYIALSLLILGCTSHHSLQELADGFQNPPQEARPQVWWHWMDGNITKEGIREDMLWFKRIGLGGVHHFDAALEGTPQIVDKRMIYMQADWKDAFAYAVRLADSLSIPMTIASSPGWSCHGGPWVEPRDGMKKLVWREWTVEGGCALTCPLPEPYKTTGRYQDLSLRGSAQHYEDIAVVAVRIPENEAKASELGSRPEVNLYCFDEPQTFAAVSLSDGRERDQWANKPADTTAVLYASMDGKAYRKVTVIPTTNAGHSTVNFTPVTGRFFKVETPGKVRDFELYTIPRVHHAEEKAGFAAPHDLADFPTLAHGTFASEAIDLTGKVNDGILCWDVPEGRWKIYRFGWSLTGKQNHPAPAEATGLEVDKMDPVAWEAYFNEYFRMYKDASEGLFGSKGIQYILTDSYEAEQETWTPAMMQEFKARRGYELLPWLPALTGEIIGTAEDTEKFLLDWRRTIGEQIAENYDHLTDIAKAHGLKGRYSESHENGRVFIVDGMDIKRRATFPMSALWVPNPWGGSTLSMAEADIRESASVAHIYGQDIAAAESFTCVGVYGRAWNYDPRSLKYLADIELANGLNRFVIHESSHQPRSDNAPGMGMSITGQWFNRHETWAEEAGAWVDYLARSSYMLQQGRNVADILIYYGEDTNVTAQYGTVLPEIPYGYNYDFASPDVLLHKVEAKNGKLVTESGQSYSVLLLGGQQKYVSDEIKARLAQLEKAGVKVCESIEEPKAALPEADFIGPKGLRYVHRTLPDAEIYWVNKPSKTYETVTASFRVKGLKPQIWHPENGRMHSATYREVNGRMEVEIPMVEDDAVFVVFARSFVAAAPQDDNANSNAVCHSERSEESVIEGPWTIRFQKGRRAPAEAVFEELTDWTESEEPGIRYFSGTATYCNAFTLETIPEKLTLNLGKVDNIAHVYVNGKDCGTLWKYPYTLDIISAAKAGENTLEIAVTNLWPNRLIGDMQPGVTPVAWLYEPRFFTTESPLLPSGLKGPVKLLFE